MIDTTMPQQRSINAADDQRSLAAATDTVDADIALAGRPIGSDETAFNDVPVIVPGGGSASYVENDSPVAVAPNLTLTDDNPTLPSATVRFASAYYPEDVLAFVNDDAAVFGNITATYDPALGMLVLTSAASTATVAQFQAALRAVTYVNTSDAPATDTRILDFRVQDGTSSIYANVRSVTVASVNDAPSGTDKNVALLPGGSHTFSEADFGFSDSDGNNFSAVVFTTLPLSGSLTFAGSPLVQGMAIARVDLGNVAFTPAPGSSGTGYASFTFQVRDNGGLANGGQNTDQSPNTFAFDAPNVAPVVTTTGGSTAFVEGSNVASTPVVVDAALTLTDDGTALAGATVSIGAGFNAAQDVLAFLNNDAAAFGNIAASYNAGTGVLTLSSAGATATVAQFQAALRAVTYTNSSDAPTTAPRTISFTANDGEFDSAVATRDVTVAASPDAPIGADVTGTVAEDGIYVFSLADFPFNDPDGDSFYSIYITSQPTAGKWYFDPGGPDGGNREDLGPWGTGFSVFASDIAAGKLFFIPDTNANGANYASFQYRLWSDNHASGQYQSAVHTFTLNVTPVNDAPVIINLDGDIATQTEGVGGTPFIDVGRNAVLTDDSADFAGGRLTVSVSNYNGLDSIGIFGDSTVTVDAGRNVSVGGVVIGVASGGQYAVPRGDTLTIDFNANATPALVQSLVRNLFVRDARIEPDGGTRDISLTLTDGDGGSATYTTSLVVTAINDEPGGADKTITINEDVGHSFAAADFGFVDNFNDGDGGISERQALEAVIITTLPAAGSLTLDGVAVTAGQRVAAADIGKLVFTPTANANGTAYASFTFQVVDNGGTANGGRDTDQSPNTITFDVTAVNDAPVLDLNGADAGADNGASYTEQAPVVTLASGLTLADVDSATLTGATVRITGGFVPLAGDGADYLGISGSGAGAISGINYSYSALTGILTLTGAASVAAYQAVLGQVTFQSTTNNPGASRTVSWTVTDGTSNSAAVTTTIAVTPVNDAPTATGYDNVTFTEGDLFVGLDTDFNLVLADIDSANFDGGTFTVRVSANKVDSEDSIIFLSGGTSFLSIAGGVISYHGVAFGTLSASGVGLDRVVTLNANATLQAVQTLMRNVAYSNNNLGNPSTEPRTISYTLTDGDGGTLNLSSTVTVVGVNDAPSTSVPGDTQNGIEDSDLVFSTANGNAISVADPDQVPVTVTIAVTNGVLTLSGLAGLSFSTGDGSGDRTMTFTGTPAAINAALEGLIYRGDLNYSGADTLSISVNDGSFNSSGSVAITLAADDVITGDGGDNSLQGTPQADYFDLSQGGDDDVSGEAGDDGFYFGGAYDQNDVVDGGAGSRDQVGLQGDYSAGVTLGSLTGVEMVVLLAGNDARFGGATGTDLAYNLVADGNTIVSGNRLTIQANTLRAGESLTFDGSASSIDFLIYGGLGTDVLTGGSGNDGFFFGQGRFGANDIVNGGAGNMDQLGFQGDFTGANALSFGAAQLLGMEYIVLLSAGDDRFGAFGGVANYDLTTHDGNVAAGATMIVSATTLRAGEALVFDGSAETDGRFEVYSGNGNDVIIGGAGDDLIFGGGRGDTLYGGAGNDVFAYRAVTDSDSTERDGIQDFTLGDRIDLSRIDANISLGGKQGFSFVGTAAFSGTAGELRYENISLGGPIYLVQGDVNGDGVSDLEIVLVMTDRNQLTAGDFIGVNAPAPGAEPLSVAPEKGAAAMVLFADDAAGPDMLMLGAGSGDLVLDPILGAGAAPADGQGLGALIRAGLSDGQPIEPVALPDLVFIGTDYDLATASSSGDLLL